MRTAGRRTGGRTVARRLRRPSAGLGRDVGGRAYRVSMRILHTSDWHIGRSFHGHATLDALRGVLETLTAQVREHEVDVVIVAGDVFDSATPAAACYTLLTDTLVALRDAGAHVIVTSGNHDSAARLGFQARLLRDGIHVLTDPLALGTPVTIDDEHGPVHFYGIPFLEPSAGAAPVAGRRAAHAGADARARDGARPRRSRRTRRSLGRDLALLRRGRRADAAPRARHPAGRHRRRAARGLRRRRTTSRSATSTVASSSRERVRYAGRAAALQLRRGRQAARLVARRAGCRRPRVGANGSICPSRAAS